MYIDFEAYRLFCAVAECESFSKAAEKLYISQPAVTQAIRKLEENLKGKLFFRTPKGVSLTDEGRRLYKYIKSSVETMKNAENKFSQYINLEEGDISVRTGSALGNILIYDAIKEFSKKYPKIKINIAGGYVKDSIEALSKGEVDLVAVNLPFETEKTNVQIIPCKEIEDCFYVSKEYYENIKNKEKVSKLIKTELIVPAEKSTTGKILKQVCEENKIEYIPKMIVTSTNARKYFVLQGLGIGFGIKDNIRKELEAGELVELKIIDNPIIRNIGIAVLKEEMLNSATIKLVETINKQ